jgi:hypothetical protein
MQHIGQLVNIGKENSPVNFRLSGFFSNFAAL